MVMRSQREGPAGTRSGWRLPVTCTGSLTRPAAVVTVTRVTGGPIAVLSAKATLMTCGLTGASKSAWIHCPTGPFQLPDSHMVRRSPSTAANGSAPLAHWEENALMSDADDDAITSLMPAYRATAWYLFQPGWV